MKIIITMSLLLSLAIVPPARADGPSDFCASLAFGIEVYEGLDQAHEEYRAELAEPPVEINKPRKAGLLRGLAAALADGMAATSGQQGKGMEALDEWNRKPVIESQIAAQNQQARLTRASLRVRLMQDAYITELERYEEYAREAALFHKSLEATRASFSTWCGPNASSLGRTGP